jgi:hypothetical protein
MNNQSPSDEAREHCRFLSIYGVQWPTEEAKRKPRALIRMMSPCQDSRRRIQQVGGPR